MIPELPTDFIVIGYTGLIISLVLATIAGILAGKQDHDSGKPELRNENIFDWLEDGLWGLLGGYLAIGMIEGGLSIPVFLIPVFGYISRKLYSRLSVNVIENIK